MDSKTLGNKNYNPCLSLRKFGYARRDGPHEMLIQGWVFNYDNNDQGLRQRFIRAWRMLNKLDSKTLGHTNSIPLEPYLKWVRTRGKNLMMSYADILPVILEPIIQGVESRIILHPDMPTNFKELQKYWIQLKEERDTFESQLYASEKNVLELTNRLHEEQNLNAYISNKRKRPWET